MKSYTLAISAFLLLFVAEGQAQNGMTVGYQAYLLDSSGTPLNGPHTISIRLYPNSEGIAPLWSDASDLQVTQGVLNVELGQTANPLPLSLPDGLWLGVAIDGATEIRPLSKVTATPYAILAESAKELRGGSVNSVNGLSGKLTIKGTGSTTVSTEGDIITISTASAKGGKGTLDVAHSVLGTQNQVLAAGTYGVQQSGDVTLSLPQNIHTAATPQFANINLTNVPSGSSYTNVVVSNGGELQTRALSSLGVSSITGTSNQIIASASTGAVTLSLPQDIAALSSPHFSDITLSSMPSSSSSTEVVVSNGGVLETRSVSSIAAPGWSLTGNAGTTSSNFIGTTDAAAVEIRSNNMPVLRLEGNTPGAANIIVTPASNTVSAGSMGNSIGGGNTNSITGNSSVIAGGVANSIASDLGYIGAGIQNHINGGSGGPASVIVGGTGNSTGSNGSAFVGGGNGNQALGYLAAIVGGASNRTNHLGFIGGGIGNHEDGSNSTIGGGETNWTTGFCGFIGGGAQNIAGTFGSIAGGEFARAGDHSSVGGGASNYAYDGYNVIGGGLSNTVGYLNASNGYATISGGRGNFASAQYSMIGGGLVNTIVGTFGVIGGGDSNYVDAGTRATVAGGHKNYAAAFGAVGGGEHNLADNHSAIPGGEYLTVGQHSFGFNAENSGQTTSMYPYDNVAYFGNVDLWIGNVDGSAREIRFLAPNTNHLAGNAKYSAFKAQAQSANVTYTLPASDGSSGQVLATNGAGTLNWASTVRWVNPPATATASGAPGDAAYDSDYMYVCISSNTWKRCALSSW
jgi:hypothetical protein